MTTRNYDNMIRGLAAYHNEQTHMARLVKVGRRYPLLTPQGAAAWLQENRNEDPTPAPYADANGTPLVVGHVLESRRNPGFLATVLEVRNNLVLVKWGNGHTGALEAAGDWMVKS